MIGRTVPHYRILDRRRQPVRPTTQRTFGRGEPVTAFMRIYQGPGRTEPIVPVRLCVRVLDVADRPVHDEALVFTEREFADNRTADCRLTLPVGSLPPGDYVLSLEASMADRMAGRALRFSVW